MNNKTFNEEKNIFFIPRCDKCDGTLELNFDVNDFMINYRCEKN